MTGPFIFTTSTFFPVIGQPSLWDKVPLKLIKSLPLLHLPPKKADYRSVALVSKTFNLIFKIFFVDVDFEDYRVNYLKQVLPSDGHPFWVVSLIRVMILSVLMATLSNRDG